MSHGEGVLTDTGSLMVETGKYTGRSPKNRYIVDAPSVHANVNWASPQNRPCDVATYDRLYANVAAHLSERELFIVRAFAGADRAYARKVMVVCERASQALFIGDLLVTPTAEELENFGRPDITVLAAPDYTTSVSYTHLDVYKRQISRASPRWARRQGTGRTTWRRPTRRRTRRAP